MMRALSVLMFLVGCPGQDFESLPADLAAGATQLQILELRVSSDENGDLLANPGERLKLQLVILNPTDHDIGAVRANVTGTALLTVTSTNDFYCGTAPAGGTLMCGSISVDVSPMAKAGSEPLDVVVSSEAKTVTGSPFLQIHNANSQPTLASLTVRKDDNSDGVANPGETIRLSVTLGNAGSALLQAVSFTMSSSDGLLAGLGDSRYCGEVPGGQITDCGEVSNIKVSETAIPGTDSGLKLYVVDKAGNSWILSTSIPILATAGEVALVALLPKQPLEAGKQGALQIMLRNSGSSDLIGVSVMPKASPGALKEDLPNELYCGQVDVGSTVTCSQLNLTPVSAGTLSLQLDVIDATGKTWNLPASAPVQ